MSMEWVVDSLERCGRETLGAGVGFKCDYAYMRTG